jgi:3-dehydroquinate synthase
MQKLEIELGPRSYPILVGPGLLGDAGLLEARIRARDVMLVSNVTVAPLWSPRLESGLAGFRVGRCILPDGEAHKTLATVARVFDALVDAGMNRDCAVLALGGGVVGDIAGFAAACYQRGVDFVQLPTTLLAQVDSSVGGKTGVDHPGGKNLIGAFHQPVAVLADTDTLQTLPDRELRAGLAEVIKYGLIRDAEFLGWIETNLEALLARDAAALEFAVCRSCQCKAAIVARDEREQGERALLNLGHSFGHAIETATGYGTWLHGEAVAVGMAMAGEFSRRLGWLDRAEVERIRALLRRAGLPVDPPGLEPARALELMRMDKKVRAGRIRLVLLESIGHAVCTGEYPDEELARLLDDLLGGATG